MVAWDLLRVSMFAVRVAVSAEVACCRVRFVAGSLLEMVSYVCWTSSKVSHCRAVFVWRDGLVVVVSRSIDGCG